MALPPRYAFLTNVPIAHRGLHDVAAGVPENTLAAFEAAIQGGHPIEMDVQCTKDEQLVVFHDHNLKRSSSRTERVRDLTAAELGAVPVFGSDQTIPTLRSTLAMVDARVPLLIEFKPAKNPEKIAALAAETLRDYHGLYAVQSFDPHLVRALKLALPQVPAGQISGTMRGGSLAPRDAFAARWLLHTAISRPDFINYELAGLPHPFIRSLTTAMGVPVLAWTVRSRADRQKAESMRINYVFDQ